MKDDWQTRLCDVAADHHRIRLKLTNKSISKEPTCRRCLIISTWAWSQTRHVPGGYVQSRWRLSAGYISKQFRNSCSSAKSFSCFALSPCFSFLWQINSLAKRDENLSWASTETCAQATIWQASVGIYSSASVDWIDEAPTKQVFVYLHLIKPAHLNSLTYQSSCSNSDPWSSSDRMVETCLNTEVHRNIEVKDGEINQKPDKEPETNSFGIEVATRFVLRYENLILLVLFWA